MCQSSRSLIVAMSLLRVEALDHTERALALELVEPFAQRGCDARFCPAESLPDLALVDPPELLAAGVEGGARAFR